MVNVKASIFRCIKGNKDGLPFIFEEQKIVCAKRKRGRERVKRERERGGGVEWGRERERGRGGTVRQRNKLTLHCD